jgi:hypothetical protein
MCLHNKHFRRTAHATLYNTVLERNNLCRWSYILDPVGPKQVEFARRYGIIGCSTKDLWSCIRNCCVYMCILYINWLNDSNLITVCLIDLVGTHTNFFPVNIHMSKCIYDSTYGNVMYMKVTDLKDPPSGNLKKIRNIQKLIIKIKIIVTTCIKFPDYLKNV